MRVAFPTYGDRGLEDEICSHFGRAPTFTIVDLEAGNVRVRVIPNTSEHMGGIGLPPELLAKEGVSVLVCSNLGPRAVQMFQSFGIKVYIGAFGKVKDALEAWQKGLLQEASEFTACPEHGHGHGHFHF